MEFDIVEDAVTELCRLDDMKNKIWNIQNDIEDRDKRVTLDSCVRLIEREKERIKKLKIQEELDNE